MNNDLISRSELKKAIDEAYKEYDGYEPDDLSRFAERVDEEIDNAPTIYPICEDKACKYRANERPQGEWVKVKENRMSIDMSGEIVTRYKCSKCERVIATLPSKLVDYYPFCHCGADMRKGGKEE